MGSTSTTYNGSDQRHCIQSMLYEVERQFKETHQDYKTDDDDLFIPYRSFKENVTEALNEALDKRGATDIVLDD